MNDPSIEPAVRGDLADIKRLLTANGLPTAAVDGWMESALVARAKGRTIGSAVLELYPSGVLLRSLVVDADWRGTGLGRRLTDAALTLARQRGASVAYLLTTTAPEFFPRFGFTPVSRADVPDDVKQSVEFTSACPSSAIVMRAYLGGA